MKILIIQNRMGIGDMVIFLPFIESISKKYKVRVFCLVKKSSKASEIFKDNKSIKELIYLEREDGMGEHDGLFGTFNLISKLKKYNFDKVFIFNSSLRFKIISKLSGIKKIYQYPLFKKQNQHIIITAKKFIKNTLKIDVESNPMISLSEESIKLSKKKFNIQSDKKNILLGIGGSGSTKRIPAKIILKLMSMIVNDFDCKFFLATGKNYEEQKILKEIMNSDFKYRCIPLDNLTIKDSLPVIKSCNISICNDSSFSHLSAAVGVQTIVMMADTPLIYGNYSPRMFPIIPDGLTTVTHNSRSKDKINPQKIFFKFKEIIN